MVETSDPRERRIWIDWPRRLQPGSRQHLVHFVDLFPTILGLAGIESPTGHPIDGESFKSVLEDASAEFAPTRYWQWNRGEPNYTHNAAVRSGSFKLVRPFVTRGIRVSDSDLPHVLYNLKEDPAETRDMSKHFPGKASEMKRSLQQWTGAIEKDRLRPDFPENR